MGAAKRNQEESLRRCFRRTGRDRLFLWFALAFCFLAIEHWMLVSVDPENEMRYSVYTFRLIAFAIIALAIIDKNRGGGRRP